MRPNPKPSLKKLRVEARRQRQSRKQKAESRTGETAVVIHPREAYLQSDPAARERQEVMIAEIGKRFGSFREHALEWAEKTIQVANEGRELGQFIQGLLKELPGHQMTLDFWQYFENKFRDHLGNPITIDQLKVLVRLADNLDQPVSDVMIAMSWRKEIQMAAGFWLEMERAPGQAQDRNFYNELLSVLSVKKLNPVLSGLEQDNRFGPIATWPAERKERFRLQIKPTKEALDKIWNELGANAENLKS